MKRWIAGLLIALAVIVFVSPGIVGKLAERNLKDGIRRVEHENDDFVVTEEKFERGWFTASGRHRIELKDGPLRSGLAELAEIVDPGRNAALIVETRIDHGLLPATSMCHDSGSLQPALAHTVSTFLLDRGDGELLTLPGTLMSRIGLAGGTASHYALDAGSYQEDGIELAWNGADLHLVVDAAASSVRYDGVIEPLRLLTDGNRTTLGDIRFDGHRERTGYGFGVGEIVLQVQAASFEHPVGGARGFGSLRLQADSELLGRRVSGRSSLELEELSLPGLAGVDLGLDIALEGVDAVALGKLVDDLKAAHEAAGGAGVPAGKIYPQIEGALEAVLRAGGELRVERFDLSLPQGEVTASLELRLPDAGRRDDFSWPGLLLAMTASADLRLPAELIAMLEARNPQAGALVAMGILKRDDDTYRLEAEYAQGLVTVNGAPMPLPLGILSGSDLRK